MTTAIRNTIQEAQDFASKLRAKNVSNKNGQSGVDPHFIEDADGAAIVENTIKTGRNAFLWGPPGTGKTSLVKNVAARLGWEVVEFNCDGETSTDNLIGSRTRGDKGEITTQWGLAVDAWVEGKILLINEPDRAGADIMSSLYQFLEDERKFVTLTIGSPEIFYRAAEYACISTANSNGNLVDAHLHAGSKQLPQAFMDRMSWVTKIGYLEADQEISVMINKTGVDPETARKLVEVATQSRVNGELEKPISLRTLISWSRNMVSTGWTAKKTALKGFLSAYTEEEHDVILEIIDGVI